MEDINVGETVVDPSTPEALPILRIDEPTLQMTFQTNNSPFAGQDGKFVTSRQLEDRLKTELETDVSLRVDDTDEPGAWVVSGRGELHLSILIETLRREGFELQVSRPEVIYRDIDGVMSEPFEEVQIDTPEEYTGSVIDSLSQRKGEMQNMESTDNGQSRLTFIAPSRGSTKGLVPGAFLQSVRKKFKFTLVLQLSGNESQEAETGHSAQLLTNPRPVFPANCVYVPFSDCFFLRSLNYLLKLHYQPARFFAGML